MISVTNSTNVVLMLIKTTFNRLIFVLKTIHPSREGAADWPHNDVEFVNGAAHTADFSSTNNIRCQPRLLFIQARMFLI